MRSEINADFVWVIKLIYLDYPALGVFSVRHKDRAITCRRTVPTGNTHSSEYMVPAFPCGGIVKRVCTTAPFVWIYPEPGYLLLRESKLITWSSLSASSFPSLQPIISSCLQVQKGIAVSFIFVSCFKCFCKRKKSEFLQQKIQSYVF